MFPAPHGVICGTLVGAATEATISKLDASHPAWGKYEKVGALLTGEQEPQSLVEQLNKWVEALEVPRLGAYGMTDSDVDRIAAAAGNKNNPIPLSVEEIREVLLARI
jgi:alcohol dehydrogenase